MTPVPYYQDEAVCIYHGDCREVLPFLPKTDHIITDPPYDARTHAGARNHGENFSRVDFAPLDVAEAVPWMLGHASRWVVCFCTMEMIGAYCVAAGPAWIRAGFWRRPDGAPQFTGDRPATPGDAIAIMHREGRKKWNGGGRHAYYDYGVERHGRGHPTQKPEGLMSAILADFTNAGDALLDPFMGSGTTIVAAKRLGRKAIGIERERAYCDIAIERLRQSALPLELGA